MIESEPRGLGGWLILVAIGLVLTAGQALLLLFGTFLPIFTDGRWEALTTKGISTYHPLWGPLLLFEVTGNVLLGIAAVTALVLFFRKSAVFPAFMIGFYPFAAMFLLIDVVAGTRIPAVASADDPGSARGLLRSLIACAIWIPYMRKSVRVRNTFPTITLLPRSAAENAAV
jgi:Protein of unknown function (DUF2569)